MITACENVCRDFNFLGNLGEWVNNFGPAIAFLGGIALFFLQRKNDRTAALRARRLEVYLETVVVLRDVILALRYDAAITEIGKLFRQFEMSYAKVLLSGVDDVIEVTNAARASVMSAMEAHASKETRRIVEANAETERLFIKCIDRMRQDMHFGTGVSSEFSSDEVADRIKELMIEANLS